MLKKLLAALGTLALVLGLVALVAGPASAHNHKVVPDCVAGVTVTLTNYNTSKGNANHLTVTLDKVVVDSESFGAGLTKTFPWAGVAASHQYTVAVTAEDDQSGSQNWTFTDSNTIKNCENGVTPGQVTWAPAVCTGVGTVGGGSYTIPTNSTGVAGYQSLVSGAWKAIAAKTYPAVPGTVVHIKAMAVTGYKFTGTSTWDFTIGSPDKTKCIVPVPPTASSSACDGTPGGSTQAVYVIPPMATGYHYTFAGSNTTLAPGTVKITKFPTTINIVLVVDTGYLVPDKTQTTWKFVFASPGDCPLTVTPTNVTPQYATCQSTPGQSSDNGFTIPASTGVTYQLKIGTGWTDLTVGFHNLGQVASSVEIRAIPQAHYSLTGTQDWPFTFSAAKDCLVTVIPKASSTSAECDANKPGQTAQGTYTLVDVTGVIYSVKVNNGSYAVKAAGTYTAKAGDTIFVLAVADTTHGYRVDGAPSWTFPFSSKDDCLVEVPAGDPVFVDGACDIAHPGTASFGTYTVVVSDHVHYVASVNGSTTPTALVEGVDNKAQPGDVVVITPIADTGYVISPVISSEKLTHTFSVPGDCLVKADYVQPQATSQSCLVTGLDGGLDGGLTAAAVPSIKAAVTHTLKDAFITIPSIAVSPHVTYYINDVEAAPGDHILKPGTYKVSAMANNGYFLQGYTKPWTEVLTSAEPCGDLITHPLVDPNAVQVQMGCFSNGSYTLSNDLFDAAALTWTVNGSTVSQGTYQVGTVGVVTIHAAASGPSYGLEQGATTDWTFHFERPTSCDLTTLALTGSSPTGWIALGYALLVAGLALLALRFTRRRGEQA